MRTRNAASYIIELGEDQGFFKMHSDGGVLTTPFARHAEVFHSKDRANLIALRIENEIGVGAAVQPAI